VLRDEFRHLRPMLAAGAYVVVARPPAASVEARVLRETLRTLLQRSGALPAPEAPGTMPPAR